MDYNLLNGGLVLKVEGELIISDIKYYETKFINDISGMFWFMNYDGNSLFYSDQKRKNSLCVMNIESQREEVMLDKPCYGVCLNDEWLYYINENDWKLYRCLKNGRGETKIVDEQVTSFIIENNIIFYTNSQGIWTCDEMGNNRDAVSNAVASEMIWLNDSLIYVDKGKHHTLTILDLGKNISNAVEGISVSSINTDGTYLYCSNRLNERSIYRIDPCNGSSIRICGESAEYLHIIEDDLYFCLNREWCKMPIAGGPFERVVR